MKTLDEVIKALEMCTADNCVCLSGCPYSYLADGDDGCEYHAIPEMQKDALHYLKEYQRDCEDLVEAAKSLTKKEHEQALTDRNDQLTWDELCSRNGMPIWIEDSFDNGEWYIIECFTASNRFVAHDRWGDTTLFNKKDMDDVWKAYRKER